MTASVQVHHVRAGCIFNQASAGLLRVFQNGKINVFFDTFVLLV
jgi:hypothetical protein